MNRRKFFKSVSVVAATTIVAPHVILAETPPVVETLASPEGLWFQLKRGKAIKYGQAGSISRHHIKEAVEYVFRNQKPTTERFIRFETGSEGRKKIRETMHAYIINGVTYTT